MGHVNMAVPGLIAKKVGMTRVVDENGNMVPVTLLSVDNQKITKICTPEKEGYHAVQVGYYEKREKRLTKPDVARLRKAGVNENYARFKEFRTEGALEGVELGTAVEVASILEGVKSVDVTGISKGRGFQGAVRRWGHATGRRTHGSRFHRRPGSLGQCTTPSRVYKNKGMPGHMGAKQRTVQNLVVLKVDAENNVIAVKGSIPGHNDGYLVVKPSVKSK